MQIQLKVQNDLNNVEEWCHENNMFINARKTKYMIIGTRQKILSLEDEIFLEINSEVLQNSMCEKLLGVKIDPNLTWTNQIDQICSKISSCMYLLSKIKKFLDVESRKMFYNGYILPIIDYCCIVWSGCNNEGLHRILKLQKRAARMILDTDPLAPSLPLFKKLGWMTVEDRIRYHKYLLTYKCIKKEAPSYLYKNFRFISESNPYVLRNVAQGNLNVPKSKTELFKNSFNYSGPQLWNNLPTVIRNAPSLNIFKNKIKDFLIN